MRQISKSLWGMLAAAIIAIVAIFLIIWNFDPNESSWPVFVLLFMAVFILLTSFSISGYYLHQLKKGNLDINELMPGSIKQGLILGTVLAIFLILQTLHVLTWLNGLSIIVIAVILSMYFKR